jgi:hypothetical protein
VAFPAPTPPAAVAPAPAKPSAPPAPRAEPAAPRAEATATPRAEATATPRAEPAAAPRAEPRAEAAATPAARPAAPSDVPSEVPSEAGVQGRRGGRVKTRLLGFDHVNGQSTDVFQKSDEAAVAQPVAIRFPVGWLVVVDGPGRGASFPLLNGVSQVGRNEDQAVQLDFGDTTISRANHAAIAFDEESRDFFIGHGGKSNLVRLNGKPLLSTETLKHGDEIRVGETTLRLVALCSESFSWAEQANEPNAING